MGGDYMNDEMAKEAEMSTLSQEISKLEKLSFEINDKVFGPRPDAGQGIPTPQADDFLSIMRNKIIDITERLRRVSNRLSLLGK